MGVDVAYLKRQVKSRTHARFALRHTELPRTVSVTFPFGLLDQQPKMSNQEYWEFRQRNAQRLASNPPPVSSPKPAPQQAPEELPKAPEPPPVPAAGLNDDRALREWQFGIAGTLWGDLEVAVFKAGGEDNLHKHLSPGQEERYKVLRRQWNGLKHINPKFGKQTPIAGFDIWQKYCHRYIKILTERIQPPDSPYSSDKL
jgi:hypothetical protein